MLVNKIESFVGRLRWKLFAIKNPNLKNKDTFGFNTTNAPPQMIELKPFEEELFSMVKNIEFKPVRNKFQNEINTILKDINRSKNVIVKADKTRNLYQIPADQYNQIIMNNITTNYKKTDEQTIKNINQEAASLTRQLDIEDRVDEYVQGNAFITAKDHKQNFASKPQFRLINPAKSNVGQISKMILEKAVALIKEKTRSNLWRNSTEAINWFKNMKNKKSFTFFKFDVESFYPSITEKLFDQTIEWAKNFVSFEELDLSIVKHARKSLLFQDSQPWVKKDNSNFDVTMGAYDGAEMCELVGLSILNKLEKLIDKTQLGLYRDDGLAVVQGSGPQLEKLRKQIFKVFQNLGLKISIETNIHSTDFLDIFFDLKNESYKPFRKNNEKPIYINSNSNHPKAIKQELPKMIAKRVSNLSQDKQTFESNIGPYQEAIESSGYFSKLEYYENQKQGTNKAKRRRNIIWFNPPYSQTVRTNVGKKFLSLVDKHFKGTNLEKYFNRSTIKISYSCLPNIDAIISGHNKRILQTKEGTNKKEKHCNCRGGPKNCPLNGTCLKASIVYSAIVKEENKISKYIGQTANSFKERFNNHKLTFKHNKYEKHTNLSNYIWNLKNKSKDFTVTWKIEAESKTYNPTSKLCKLCNLEKTLILTYPDENLLNKRSEIMNKCRHREKYLLVNT